LTVDWLPDRETDAILGRVTRSLHFYQRLLQITWQADCRAQNLAS